MEEEEEDPRLLKHPFSLLLSGPSQSGKTYWTIKLIEKCRQKVVPPIDRVVFVYNIWQPHLSQTLRQSSPVPVQFTDSVETIQGRRDVNQLVIIDDHMDCADMEKEVVKFFIKRVHHENLSCAYMVQNLYHASKLHRTISLNANYLWIGANRRAADQIRTLAVQVFPGRHKFLQDVYDDVTSRPYGYLFLDFKQTTPEDYRVKTDVLSDTPVVYLPKQQ